MVIRRIHIGQSNSPLRAILLIEDDTKVIAVERPNGSTMEYKDIPQWVFMDIRNRGMVYIGGVLSKATQQPAPFGYRDACKYGAYFVLGMLAIFVIISIVSTSESDSSTTSPVVAAVPTPTPTPIPWYTPAEITEVYKSHRTRANVLFEQGEVYIQSTLAEMHPSKPGLVYLVERRRPATDLALVMMETDADRDAKDWHVIRAQLPPTQVVNLEIGDAIGVRCDSLDPDPHVGTGAELVCLKATLVKP